MLNLSVVFGIFIGIGLTCFCIGLLVACVLSVLICMKIINIVPLVKLYENFLGIFRMDSDSDSVVDLGD